MTTLSLRSPEIIAVVTASGLLLGGIAYVMLRKKPTAEELERARRTALVKFGRIVDGTVLDIAELDAEQSGRPEGLQLILYRYEIAGVVYECAQDVTLLKEFVDIHNCGLGLPASIRYDPHNPQNSLLVAETWTGVRLSSGPWDPKAVRLKSRAAISQ